MMRRRLVRYAKKNGRGMITAYGAGQMARAAYNSFGRGTKRSRSGIAQRLAGGRTMTGTTVQHDRVRQYTKRRGRINKRWRKFKRQVRAVQNLDLGAQTRVFNQSENSTNSDPLLNGVFEQHLYPAGTVYADLQTIAGELNSGNPTAALGITVAPTTKLRFRTAILDMTVRNSSFFTATGGIDSAYALEVDLYEILAPVPARDGGVVYNTMVTQISGSMLDQKRIAGAGSSVWATAFNLPNRGSTPFEYSHWLSENKIKILKKTKYFLNGGATFTHQIRDKKDRYCTISEIVDSTGFAYKNWTKSVLIFFKLVPGITVGPGPSGITERLSIGTTRKYLYTYEGQNEAKDRIN